MWGTNLLYHFFMLLSLLKTSKPEFNLIFERNKFIKLWT